MRHPCTRHLWIVALCLVTSVLGCVQLPRQPQPPTSGMPIAIVQPVTADQVNAANAHKMAESEWDQIDREQRK